MSFDPMDYPVCFTTPKRQSDITAWVEHIPFAMVLTQMLRPRTLVELGSHYGDSYCAFCQAIQQLSLATRCTAVDTWAGDEHTGAYGPEVLADLRAHHDPLYGSFSTLMQTTFDEAARRITTPIDLLHIDGLHTYDAVKRDYETWRSKMSERGVILFHDTAVREKDFGVHQLWEELSAKHPETSFEFQHGNGLGVLGVGGALGPEVTAFFAAGRKDAQRIRMFYLMAGQRVLITRLYEQVLTRVYRSRLMFNQWRRMIGESFNARVEDSAVAARSPLKYSEGLVSEVENLLNIDLARRGMQPPA